MNTLKLIALQLLMSVLAGILFCASAIFVIYVNQEFTRSPPRKEWHTIQQHELPDTIRLVSSTLDPTTSRMTVRGTIRNDSARLYETIRLVAVFKLGGMKVNGCEGQAEQELPAGEVGAFEITCQEMDGGELPAGMQYEVWARTATYTTEPGAG